MKLFDEVRAPLMLTPWKPPPGRCWTPGVTLSSELKSRPLSGIASMRSVSTRLFSLSENSTTAETPSTVTVSDDGADLELEVHLGHSVGRDRRFAGDGLEPGEFGGHAVETAGELGNREAALRVGDGTSRVRLVSVQTAVTSRPAARRRCCR